MLARLVVYSVREEGEVGAYLLTLPHKSEANFCSKRALATDVDLAGGGVGNADALEVEVLNRSIGIGSDVDGSSGVVAQSYSGEVEGVTAFGVALNHEAVGVEAVGDVRSVDAEGLEVDGGHGGGAFHLAVAALSPDAVVGPVGADV